MSEIAKLIRRAERAGLRLSVSPAGKLAYSGPRDAVERFKPALASHRDEILAELKAANDRALNWWTQRVDGWPERLTIRNIARDEMTTIDLRSAEPWGSA